jgi:hypothetical protein
MSTLFKQFKERLSESNSSFSDYVLINSIVQKAPCNSKSCVLIWIVSVLKVLLKTYSGKIKNMVFTKKYLIEAGLASLLALLLSASTVVRMPAKVPKLVGVLCIVTFSQKFQKDKQ